jgi:hypothetical protein
MSVLRDPKESSDDSRKGYDLALAALREQHIRRHAIPPRPDRPDEVRWAKEGEVAVQYLETVRDRP